MQRCEVVLALLTDASLPPNISAGSRPGLGLGGLDQYDISPVALGGMPQRQPVTGSLQRPQMPGHTALNPPVSCLVLLLFLSLSLLCYKISYTHWFSVVSMANLHCKQTRLSVRNELCDVV